MVEALKGNKVHKEVFQKEMFSSWKVKAPLKGTLTKLNIKFAVEDLIEIILSVSFR